MTIVLLKIFGVVLSLICFLFTIRAFGKHYYWHPELQRKILHVGLGLTSLSFPWVFDQNWQVAAVCFISTLVLLLVRTIPQLRNSIGKSIYDVKRSSLGELLFALSIILLFWLSDKNVVLYIVPLAILTLSDAGAALVGTRYGKKLFDVIGGKKSWEGTIAFTAITFVILLILLHALTALSWGALVMIAITFAILGALIEAISWHGLDNLFIPVGAYLFLNAFLHHDEAQLFVQLIILSGLVAFGLIAGPKSQLNTHALMTATISLYFFWVVGGIIWLIAPILVFLFHVALVKIQHDEGNYTANTILSVTSGGFFWILVGQLFQMPYSFFLFTFALSIHLQIIVLLRLKAYRGRTAEPIVVLLVGLLPSGLVLSTALLYYGVSNSMPVMFAFALLVLFIGGIELEVTSDRFSRQRWVTEAMLAFIGSASGLIPLWAMGMI